MEEKPAVYEVTIKRRSFLGRLVRVPGTFWGHYKLHRKHWVGRRESISAAWRLASLLLKDRAKAMQKCEDCKWGWEAEGEFRKCGSPEETGGSYWRVGVRHFCNRFEPIGV